MERCCRHSRHHPRKHTLIINVHYHHLTALCVHMKKETMERFLYSPGLLWALRASRPRTCTHVLARAHMWTWVHTWTLWWGQYHAQWYLARLNHKPSDQQMCMRSILALFVLHFSSCALWMSTVSLLWEHVAYLDRLTCLGKCCSSHNFLCWGNELQVVGLLLWKNNWVFSCLLSDLKKSKQVSGTYLCECAADMDAHRQPFRHR